jgi:hypothetical protein
MEILPVFIIAAVLFGIVGLQIGAQKDNAWGGFLLGLFFGPFGPIYAALIDRRNNCPVCGTKLNGKPQICGGCRTDFKWVGEKCTYHPPKGQ